MVGMPEASDAQLVARLTGLGMEAWLAEHLVQWLPLAYAERVFQGVRLIRTYGVVGGSGGSLDNEPIFLAASERAKRAGREECLAIAPRSSIHSAINNGANAARARGVPFDMRGDASVSLFSALPPIEPGDGGVPRVHERFQEHIANHGFKTLPTGLSMDAFVYPEITASDFCIHIDLIVRDPRITKEVVIETVLGEGHTIRGAVNQAASKLELNVMHVFFASLVDHHSCADQVFWEDWQHQLGALRVCHGGELHFYNPEHIPPFTPLLEELKAALAEEPLANGFHALRIFTSHQGERTLGEEVRLDGELWPRGMEVMRAHAWPHVEVPWGVRFFAMMEASAEVN